MKKGISLIGLVCSIAFAVFFVLIPVRAEAATTLKTYTEGKVVRTQTSGKVLYEYTVDVDSLVEISFDYNISDEGGVRVYADKEMNCLLEVQFFFNTSGKVFTVLSEGTYYIDFYEDYSGRTTKLKMTSTPASKYSKGNYCKAKAQSLEAKKWAKAVQTQEYEYCRWYEIKVPKTQKVTIHMPSGYIGNVFLFNSKITKKYELNTEWDIITTQNRIPAGTYYIVVHEYNLTSYNNNGVGVYYQFRWY